MRSFALPRHPTSKIPSKVAFQMIPTDSIMPVVKHQASSSSSMKTAREDLSSKGDIISSSPGPSSRPSTLVERQPKKQKKSLRFWLIFASLMVTAMLTALDMTIVSTSLPTIVKELPTSSVSASWITSAFLLTTTAFQPMLGGLADVFGRRNSFALSIVFFLVGSVISAMAKSMLLLVVGRGVQGVGGGGIQALVEIIISDLTTLKERGIYVGLISLVFAAASFIAPVLGGYFSEHNWRWIFWLNLPIGACALAIVVPCMKIDSPRTSLSKKIHRMDIVPNLFLLAGMIGILIAITEGGIDHPWSSWRIIVPLITGLAGLAIFFGLDFFPTPISRDPVLPLRLFNDRTKAACYLLTFFHGMIIYGEIYMLPVYFQTIKGSNPLKSAIQIFPATAPGPFSAIAAGVFMALTGKYKWQMTAWWAMLVVGTGLLYLMHIDTPTWQWVIFQIICGLPCGALFTLTLPPIQASLPIEELAHATAAFTFARSFGSVWGIALGTNVFIGTINPKLAAIPGLEQIGLRGSTSLAFATELSKIPAELLDATKLAYADALRLNFVSFLPLAAVGFLISFLVRSLPLPDFNRSEHTIAGEKMNDEEMAATVDTAVSSICFSDEKKQHSIEGPERSEAKVNSEIMIMI